MTGVIERVLDRRLPPDVRIDAIRYLGEWRSLSALVALAQVATADEEPDDVAEEAGRAIALILNNGVLFNQFELRDFSAKALDGFCDTWEGKW